MGAMYTAITFMGTQSAASVRPVIIAERTVFYRERAAGMYSALLYAFAQVVKHNLTIALPPDFSPSPHLNSLFGLNFPFSGCY